MQSYKTSDKTRINFYLNLINFLPFIVLIFSGALIQINYHMHHLPDDYLIMGMDKLTWLIIHKTSTAVSLTGCILHCVLHWKYIKAATKNIVKRKSKIKIFSSYYLFLTGILTSIPVILSWSLLKYDDSLRHILVEIHDKLAIIFMFLGIIHLVSRTKWMFTAYRKLRQ